ncbi:uncharacterized protein LOC144876466 [Branchiostoma floridae x Branchiostoma japonicum]
MRRPRLSRRPPTSRGERSPWVEIGWTVTLLIAVASVGKGEDNVDCYRAADKGASYIGTVNVTVNGLVCQRWDQQAPWTHRWNPSDHPDKNLASNYCRNPDNGSGPWCYTTNPDVSFEYCNVSVCPNVTTAVPTTTTLATTTTTATTTTATTTTMPTTTTATTTTATTTKLATTTTTLATTTRAATTSLSGATVASTATAAANSGRDLPAAVSPVGVRSHTTLLLTQPLRWTQPPPVAMPTDERILDCREDTS